MLPVSTDTMNVTQVSYSINGAIGFHLTMLDDNDFDVVITSYEAEHGILYFTPMDTIIDSENNHEDSYFYYDPDCSCAYTIHNWERVDNDIRQIYLGTEKDIIE